MSDPVDSGSSAVLWTFGAYMVAVFFLAWLAGRVKEEKKEGFMSDYFLGSRGFGVWALALTAAATSASGGSFMGFPALIYTHGWVLALWIAGYMIVPLVGMGLLALAWGALGLRLLRTIWVTPPGEERRLAMGIGLMLVAIHAYGMGDFPDGIVQSAQLWLIPAALVATRRGVAEAKR